MRARIRWLAGSVWPLPSRLAVASGVLRADPSPQSDPGAKAGGKPGPIAITVADSQPPEQAEQPAAGRVQARRSRHSRAGR